MKLKSLNVWNIFIKDKDTAALFPHNLLKFQSCNFGEHVIDFKPQNEITTGLKNGNIDNKQYPKPKKKRRNSLDDKTASWCFLYFFKINKYLF